MFRLLLILFVLMPILAVAEPLQVARTNALTSTVVFPLLSPRLSSRFGARNHPIYGYVRHHDGVDLAAPTNSHVRAIRAGKVIFADSYGGYGKLVTIAHDDGCTSLYGHLSAISVTPGQVVKPGTIIGRVGSTGAATGPHLHFEYRFHGEALNPLHVFPSLAKSAQG